MKNPDKSLIEARAIQLFNPFHKKKGPGGGQFTTKTGGPVTGGAPAATKEKKASGGKKGDDYDRYQRKEQVWDSLPEVDARTDSNELAKRLNKLIEKHGKDVVIEALDDEIQSVHDWEPKDARMKTAVYEKVKKQIDPAAKIYKVKVSSGPKSSPEKGKNVIRGMKIGAVVGGAAAVTAALVFGMPGAAISALVVGGGLGAIVGGSVGAGKKASDTTHAIHLEEHDMMVALDKFEAALRSMLSTGRRRVAFKADTAKGLDKLGFKRDGEWLYADRNIVVKILDAIARVKESE